MRVSNWWQNVNLFKRLLLYLSYSGEKVSLSKIQLQIQLIMGAVKICIVMVHLIA